MTRMLNIAEPNPSQDLLSKAQGPYSTILADPPWQFQNRTGKVAPEHKRLLAGAISGVVRAVLPSGLGSVG